MSTNMTLITSVTVGSGGAASVTLPASGTIPQTYTDLKIVMSVRDSGSGTEQNIKISFNGVGGTAYTSRLLYGSGSGAFSYTQSPSAALEHQYANASGSTANTFSNNEIYIPNYTSSNYKSVSVDTVVETNATATSMGLSAGLFSNTGAITTITLAPYSGSNTFVEGSTFYLYGISSVTSTPKATGGMVSQDSTYWYHTFATSGIFTPTTALSADILCVAGGGGGAYNLGGGGGAGGVRGITSQSLTTTAYTITVGSGGSGGTSAGTGASGGNSSIAGSGFSTITASGGGGGGGEGYNGVAGGSGGGGSYNWSGGTGNSGSYSPVEGYAGGGPMSPVNNPVGGNGGGGAGGVGGLAVYTPTGLGGNGGVGTLSYSSWANATFTGVNGYYAGGGGGGELYSGDNGGVGGFGGGGNGAVSNTNGSNALVNTGSGGGGGGQGTSSTKGNGGNGGSGLVIVRYAK